MLKKKLDRKSLGARLREARLYRGFSQEEVAKYVGVSRSSISLMESGSRKVDTLELQKFAELYASRIDDLVYDEPPPAGDTKGITMVARAAAKLSPSDQEEVLRFAEFLQARKGREKNEEP